MANHATSVEDRLTCIEHIVTSRSAALEYLAAFHTLHEPAPKSTPPPSSSGASAATATPAAGAATSSSSSRRTQALWMDTIVITRSDMVRFYEPHDTGLGAPVAGDFGTASPSTPPPSPSSTNSSAGGLRALSSHGKQATVSPQWLAKNVPGWYALGCGLAALIVEPALSSGAQFIAAARELMLELDCQAAVDHGSGPRRALAQRALRQDREERGVAMIRPHPNTAYVYNTTTRPAFGVPSYLRVAGSLLATLVLVYRKLMDVDLAGDSSAYHRFVQFDAAIDATVIQPIVKEMEKVAQRKLALDADFVFETFDHIAEPESEPSQQQVTKRVDPNNNAPGVASTEGGSGSKSKSWSSWIARGVKSLASGKAGSSSNNNSSSGGRDGSGASHSLHARTSSLDGVAT